MVAETPSHSLAVTSVGILLPAALPFLHLGILYRGWTSHKREVDKDLCSCSCWDTIFKGEYQGTDAPGYKHFYFNVTWQSLVIWFSTVISVIVLYECTKYLLNLAVSGKLSFPPSCIFVASLYPHYYTWWSYVNIFNDDFYKQVYHQAVFSLTEIISTALILPMCNKSTPRDARSILIVVIIAAFHITASACDQFVQNVLWNNGEWYQFSRDIGFMVMDVLTLLIAYLELWKVSRNQHITSVWKILTFDETIVAIFTIVVLSVILVFT